MWRERSAWIALIAVLSTSLTWLALLCGIALASAHGVPPAAFTLARVLTHALVAVAARTWPLLPLVLLAGMMFALVASRALSLKRKIRHV